MRNVVVRGEEGLRKVREGGYSIPSKTARPLPTETFLLEIVACFSLWLATHTDTLNVSLLLVHRC